VRKLRTDNLQALISQASQTALCNQHHSLQQRLMRLLECIFERMGNESLRITQSQLANLLGTRRERVSHAAAALEDMGLIQRTRGQIRITDLC
jgi:DNA-binding MarR family transcriptional regulator